jgi:hypothetical protein
MWWIDVFLILAVWWGDISIAGFEGGVVCGGCLEVSWIGLEVWMEVGGWSDDESGLGHACQFRL